MKTILALFNGSLLRLTLSGEIDLVKGNSLAKSIVRLVLIYTGKYKHLSPSTRAG